MGYTGFVGLALAAHLFVLAGADAARATGVTVRIATFNVSMVGAAAGELAEDLQRTDNPRFLKLARIIRRVAPDILLINEFDHDAEGVGLARFRAHYLETPTISDPPAVYPYAFAAAVNTGVFSGADLDGNGMAVARPGEAGYAADAFGYGAYPGQYGMMLLSRFPLAGGADIRTFRTFLWQTLPDALLPDNLETPEPGDYYGPQARAVFRLSSKSHWDIPIDIAGRRLHVLAMHPTPPVFDGPEDRNGRRNFDEIRLFRDYVTPGAANYLVDDREQRGGLRAGARFVILGDLNADPADGDSFPGAVTQLLEHPGINGRFTPASNGAIEAADRQAGYNRTHAGDPRFDTADFGDTGRAPGNLRVDYVLPSNAGLTVQGGGVFWPRPGTPGSDWIDASDHRLVYLDVTLH